MRTSAKRLLGGKRKKKSGKRTKVKIKIKGSPDGVTKAVKNLAGSLGQANQI